MGRGRSKARETRVARVLKYSKQEMDLEKLAEELHGELPEVKENDHNYTVVENSTKLEKKFKN